MNHSDLAVETNHLQISEKDLSFPDLESIKKISELVQSFLFKEFVEAKIENVSWEQFGKAVKISADLF